jgi:Effector-associated domain 11
MDKNYIIELIKNNQLQDALKVMESASKEGDLHNDIISISATYSEYVRSNRSATEDFQTLEIQRARITKSMLSVLEDIPETAFEKLPKPALRETPQTFSAPTQISEPLSFFTQYKSFVIGGGVVLFLLIGFCALSGDGDGLETPTQSTEQTPMSNPANNPVNNMDLTNGVHLVEYLNSDNSVGQFVQNGNTWVENNKFKFREVRRADGIIFLRDNSRKMDLELDLVEKFVHFKYDSDNAFKPLIAISHFE